MHPLLSFGLSPGNGLVLVALIEMANPLASFVIDYSGLMAKDALGLQKIGGLEILWLLIFAGEVALTLGLFVYGTILMGNKVLLLWWIGISTTLVFIFSLIEICTFDWSSEGIWYTLNGLYIIVVYLILFAYEVNLSVSCLPHFTTIGNLEPIGKGWNFVIDYYKTHPKEAAMLALMFEIVFNSLIFFDRQVTRFVFTHDFMGHENETNGAVLTEETVLRYLRIGLAIGGFCIAYKGKQYWMFRWCMCYLFTIALSLGIFAFLIFTWRAAEHLILTLMYFAIFVVNLLYRTGVLYLCVRYTDVFERMGIPM